MRVARLGGDTDPHRPAAGADPVPLLDVDASHCLGEAHHDARHAAVAHDQVRADSDRKDGDGGIEAAEETGEVLHVLRPHQPLRRPAGAEPDEVGERAAGLDGAFETGDSRLPHRPQQFIFG
jgi:hypothetical protein